MNLKTKSLLLLITVALTYHSCGVYSFTGASISPEIKTISIQTFYNNAPLGPSNMSQLFTEKIKDYYQQNTQLTIVEDEGDLQLEGVIENYTVTPVAAAASQSSTTVDFASLTRVSIFVSASYINTQDDTYDFDKRFSWQVDFDQNSQDLTSNEEDFVNEIFDQIILDIFNSSVANW